MKKHLKLRHASYKHGNGITLLGMPHPVAFGFFGYPVNFPENAQEFSTVGKFIRSVLNK